jgi:hypothetical protein
MTAGAVIYFAAVGGMFLGWLGEIVWKLRRRRCRVWVPGRYGADGWEPGGWR